ncbi:unnamed protein product [Orchesella dallaii]|uniref:Uncharacterized protein n=1 Tax=Orchesella dallaii TaxID=48710 RepID=A0ABP1PHI1_9HEXA
MRLLLCCKTHVSQANNIPTPYVAHCLIHVIYKNPTTAPNIDRRPADSLLPMFFGNATTFSYTFHQIEYFNFLPGPNHTDYSEEDFDSENVPVNTKSGFHRFGLRLSCSLCTAYVINTQTFNETLTAIRHSGQGTSEHVMFLIDAVPLTTENNVIRGLVEDLFLSEGTPFHAPILFFNAETKELATYCYCCPSDLERIHILGCSKVGCNLNEEAQKYNLEGYGSSVFIPNSLGILKEAGENCFRHYHTGREQTHLFGEDVDCLYPELWIAAPIQQRLNISFTIDTSRKPDEQKWSLQIRFAEGLQLVIPNYYLFTRGSVIISEKLEMDLLACLDIQKVQAFDFGIISALDIASWCVLVGLIFLYGLVTQNIWKGLDVLLTFIGKSVVQKHVKSCLYIVLVSTSMLSYIYQSTISAESMKLTEFPEFRELFRKDYRIWVEMKAPVTSIVKLFSNYSKNGLEKFTGVDITEPNLYFEGEGDQHMANPYNNTVGMLERAARYNLFVTSLTEFAMFKVVGWSTFSVNEKLLCKVDRVTEDFDLPFGYTMRTWGYLSVPFSKLVATNLISGAYDRVLKLRQGVIKSEMTKWHKDAANFMDPKPIGLMSPLGVYCGIIFATFGIALVWWGIKVCSEWPTDIVSKVRNMRQQWREWWRTKVFNFIRVRPNS